MERLVWAAVLALGCSGASDDRGLFGGGSEPGSGGSEGDGGVGTGGAASPGGSSSSGGSGAGGHVTSGGVTGGSGGEAPCAIGDTRFCVGPGACAGAQECLEDRSGFGSCDCGGTGVGGSPPGSGGAPGSGGRIGCETGWLDCDRDGSCGFDVSSPETCGSCDTNCIFGVDHCAYFAGRYQCMPDNP